MVSGIGGKGSMHTCGGCWCGVDVEYHWYVEGTNHTITAACMIRSESEGARGSGTCPLATSELPFWNIFAVVVLLLVTCTGPYLDCTAHCGCTWGKVTGDDRSVP